MFTVNIVDIRVICTIRYKVNMNNIIYLSPNDEFKEQQRNVEKNILSKFGSILFTSNDLQTTMVIGDNIQKLSISNSLKGTYSENSTIKFTIYVCSSKDPSLCYPLLTEQAFIENITYAKTLFGDNYNKVMAIEKMILNGDTP